MSKQLLHHVKLFLVKGTERHFAAALNTFDNPHSFFELIRLDFVVDDNLNVFLMEVNMSPNLSTDQFKQNRALYEQVQRVTQTMKVRRVQVFSEGDLFILSTAGDSSRGTGIPLPPELQDQGGAGKTGHRQGCQGVF